MVDPVCFFAVEALLVLRFVHYFKAETLYAVLLDCSAQNIFGLRVLGDSGLKRLRGLPNI